MAGANPKAAGYSVAAVSAAGMLILGIFGNLGIYTGAVEAMRNWHMFFSLSAAGIIAGMVEAAVFGFVFAYAVIYLYNKFS